jgi:hypothetical protein
MLFKKKRAGGRVITCMKPDWPLAKYMDLCFIPEHDLPREKDNVFITLGPPNTAFDYNSHDSGRGLIVVGGKDKKTHHWHNEKVIRQIRWILKTQTDIAWTISTSPRTPESMTNLLKEMEKDFPGMVFIPFKQTPSGWIEEQYALSKFAWVTADSVSMVYEALSAGCLVGILSVDWKNSENKLARAIKLLEKKNKIVTYENFKCKPGYPEYCVMNEARRCAEEILKSWWPDRLQ